MALPECAPFRASLRVYGLDDARLADQAVAAYDAVAALCAAGGTVRVQGENGATVASIPCKRRLKPRPVWYQLRD